MRRLFFLIFVSFFATAAFAQEFRGTILGRVVDASGAVVPHAQITIVNTETGVKSPSTSNADGQYTVPFLQPGKYSISATAPGFKSYTRSNVSVQANDKIDIDLPLTIGTQDEQVSVSADAPLLQTASSTSGQVLTTEEIENLPDNGRSPLALAKTEYAVVPKQKNSVVRSRPFDNSAASDFSIGGGASQSNEYLLNGVPNMQNSSRLPGFSPFQDSVAEVRVDVFQADATYGDTSNGVVNLITKSGGNRFHGTASEFNQFSAINAPLRWFASGKQFATRQNQYGGTIGGPIWIPKVYNGRDKLFFFYAYEGFKGSDPNVTVTTVPTAAERRGDFSALLAKGSAYQLYNPFTATQSGTNVVRTPIPGNILTNAGPLNPVALAYLNYFPLPNLPGTDTGENNYSANLPTTFNYNSHSGRIDFALNDNNRIFFETHRSEYTNGSGRVFPNISTGSVTYTVHQGGVLDFVHTFSPRYTLDTRMGVTRTYSNGTIASQGTAAASVGLPAYLNPAGAPLSLPVITFSDSYRALSSNPGSQTAFDTISLFSALTAARGNHLVKAGIDFRANKNSVINVGNSSNLILNGANVTSGATSGSFTFGSNFLTAGTGATAPPYGASLASFLLGLPTGGTFNINPQTTYNSWYFAGFLQDDWKVRPNFTINTGLRIESETGINESHDKAAFFDPTLTNSVTTLAQTAYTAAPLTELPAASFNAKGGFVFASPSRRNEYFTPKAYLSPRIGIAFTPDALHGKTVLRAGFGLFFSPLNDYYTPQNYGYSSTAALVPTTNNYLTPAATLSNPFPAGNPIVQPTGSSLGVNTYLGQAINVRDPHIKGTYVERWNFDIQQQFTSNLLFQVGYIGAHQVNATYTDSIGAAPLLPYLSRSPAYDKPTQTRLTGTVTNPFKGLPGETGTLATASTISRATLLQAYPQYASVTQSLKPGASTLFHELAVRLQKRTSHGLTAYINYQWSHNLSTSQLNPGDQLVYQENASDFPNHFAIAGSYVLPIGRGKTFLSKSNRVVDAAIGGFTVNTIYQYLTGAFLSWGNPYFANGTSYDSRLKIRPRDVANGAIDKTLFPVDLTQQPTAYNYRTFPLMYGHQDATNNLDASILKDFRFGESVRLQYRFEAYNVLNHTTFGAPNTTPNSASLGAITSTSSVPRTLQQGLRLVF